MPRNRTVHAKSTFDRLLPPSVAVTQNSAVPVEVRWSPDHPCQLAKRSLARIQQASLSCPNAKNWASLFLSDGRPAFQTLRSRQKSNPFFATLFFSFLQHRPHTPPSRYNVLASRPDIAGSAHSRCSAHFCCRFDCCAEDRHDQCGFGPGRQELHSPGEWRDYYSEPGLIHCLLILEIVVSLFLGIAMDIAENWNWLELARLLTPTCPKPSPMRSLSRSGSAMRASRPTSSTRRPTPSR